MIKNLFIMIGLFYAFSLPIFAQTNCANGGLEQNNFSNWNNYYGDFNGGGSVSLSSLTNGTAPGRHTIMNMGNDPILAPLGVNMPQVIEGNHSFRLGNSAVGADADHTRYTFTVTNANKDFSFRYAMVLENPTGHDPDEQPFFGFTMFKGSAPTFNNLVFNRIDGQKWTADSSNPFFKTAGSNIVYREWSTRCVDLSAYVGEQVTIMFTTVDCSLGGHFGYAYIDGMCGFNGASSSFTIDNEFCPTNPVIADGSNSINEDSHFWSIQESNANWDRIGPEYTQWFVAQQAGPFNLKSFIESNGGTLKCNTYYRVKLAVSNECVPWDETSRLIYMSCPTVSAGRDLCCTYNSNNVRNGIGSNFNSDNYTYQWSPTLGLQNPTGKFTAVDCNSLSSLGRSSITYTLTATDKNGCQNSDDVTIFFDTPYGTITQDDDCCSNNLTFSGGNYSSFVWSTGQQNVENIVVDSPGTYTVTATNPCGSRTFSIDVGDGLDRYYANLNDESIHSYYSSSTNVNSFNTFNIWHVEDPAPSYGEYYATEYKLEIYNRWGEIIRTITDSIDDCQGFDNPAIHWDGTVNGSNVQSGIYNGKLYLKNCRFKNWKPVKVDWCQEWGNYTCLETDCQFWIGSFECGFFQKEICLEWQDPQCIDQRKEYVFPINIQF